MMLGVILLVLLPSLTIADEPAPSAFGAPISYLVGDAPQSITTRDLDGDGILDVVTANERSDDVSVLPGIGDGTFGEAVHYAAGSGPQDVTIADFDKDGALDMIVANRFSYDVTTVANDQGIGFFHQHVYPVGSGPEDIVMDDFNEDGLADFATSNDPALVDDNVAVRLARPSYLPFGMLATYPVGRRPLGIASGDLNLDGHVDLVNANRYSDSVTVLLGNGDGTFQDGGRLRRGIKREGCRDRRSQSRRHTGPRHCALGSQSRSRRPRLRGRDIRSANLVLHRSRGFAGGHRR